ncbi:MAG: hypothetical protein ABSB79_10690 [Syntrophales bacterium]
MRQSCGPGQEPEVLVCNIPPRDDLHTGGCAVADNPDTLIYGACAEQFGLLVPSADDHGQPLG